MDFRKQDDYTPVKTVPGIFDNYRFGSQSEYLWLLLLLQPRGVLVVPDLARTKPRKPRQAQIDCSRRWIVEAYSKLLAGTPDDRITVSAICSAAGVGRQTFYRHFRSKKDVFKYQMEHGYELYCEKLKGYPPDSLSIDILLYEAFDFWKKNQAVLNPLAQSDELKFWFIERFRRIWRRIARNFLPASDAHEYDIEFEIAGITGVFLHWLERDMNESPAEITQLIMALLDDRKVLCRVTDARPGAHRARDRPARSAD